MALDSSNWNLVLQALRSKGDARAAKASALSGGIQNLMSGVNSAIDMYADKQRRDADQARRDADQARRDAELADQRAYAEKMMLEGRQYDEGQAQQAFTRQLVARDMERSAQDERAKQERDRAAAEAARRSSAVSQLLSPMTGMRPAFGEKPTFSAMGLPISVESRAPTEQEMARRFRPSMPVDALSTARPFASPEPKPVNPMDAMMERAKLAKLLEEIRASEAKRTEPAPDVAGYARSLGVNYFPGMTMDQVRSEADRATKPAPATDEQMAARAKALAKAKAEGAAEGTPNKPMNPKTKAEFEAYSVLDRIKDPDERMEYLGLLRAMDNGDLLSFDPARMKAIREKWSGATAPDAGSPPGPAPASGASTGDGAKRVVNGKTYVRRNGAWVPE